MAKLFLDPNVTCIAVSGNVTVIGATTGTGETVEVGAGVTVDANVETIDFSGNLADYTFELVGNQLAVSLNGVVAATLSLTGEEATLRFADGSAPVKLSGLDAGTLGGVALPGSGTTTTTDAPIAGVALDATDPSGNAGTGGGAATYSLDGTAALSMNEDATDVTYTVTTTNVADGNLAYTLSGTGIEAADITGGLTGNVAIVNGTGTFTVSALADLSTGEGDETLVVTLDDDRTATVNTTIVDNSTTPVAGSGIDINANDPADTAATAAADTFNFNPSTASTSADADYDLTGFDTANDKIIIDLPTVPAGVFNSLDDLAGIANGTLGPISVAPNPFTGEMVAIFGNDAGTGAPIQLTLAGVADASTVVIELI